MIDIQISSDTQFACQEFLPYAIHFRAETEPIHLESWVVF